MLHMVVGGVLGCAIYAQGLAYYVPDNLARYGAAIDHVSFSSSPFNLGPLHGRVYQSDDGSEHQADLWLGGLCLYLPIPAVAAL